MIFISKKYDGCAPTLMFTRNYESKYFIRQHSDHANEKKSVILRYLIDIYTHTHHYQSLPHLQSLNLNCTKSQLDSKKYDGWDSTLLLTCNYESKYFGSQHSNNAHQNKSVLIQSLNKIYI